MFFNNFSRVNDDDDDDARFYAAYRKKKISLQILLISPSF
mgnify:CR=1 FL=1